MMVELKVKAELRSWIRSFHHQKRRPSQITLMVPGPLCIFPHLLPNLDNFVVILTPGVHHVNEKFHITKLQPPAQTLPSSFDKVLPLIHVDKDLFRYHFTNQALKCGALVYSGTEQLQDFVLFSH